MSTFWEAIKGFCGWFFQYHVIFRTAAIVLFLVGIWTLLQAISQNAWMPLVISATAFTCAVFAFILTHPESLGEHH